MNFEDILSNMVAGLQQEIGAGIASIRGFIDDQGKLLAKQAEMLAKSRATGSLRDDDELFAFFLEGLETNTRNLARVITMHSIITIEKAWNALAHALWGGIRSILQGAGFPDPLLPPDPPFSF